MGLINQSTFVNKMMACPAPTQGGSSYNREWNTPGLRGEIASALGVSRLNARLPEWLANVDEASAIECYNQIKNYIQNNGYLRSKSLRPWHLDEGLTTSLDRRQVWFGFEFETGYRSSAARAEVIGHCWDNYDGVVFDAEGEGEAAVEITFTPQEEYKFRDGTAQATRFMEYLTANKDKIQKSGSMNIGTHINISHPAMTPKNIESIVRSMNRTVAALEQNIDGVGNVRMALFGRSHLYGGFYVQSQTNGVWTEGKLFRTVYTMNEFQRYLQTCYALSAAMKAIIAATEDKANAWHLKLKQWAYVANLYEMAREGAEPVIRWTSVSGTWTHNSGGELSVTLRGDKSPQTEAEAAELLAKKAEEERQRAIKEAEAKARALEEAKLEEARRVMNAAGEQPDDLDPSFTWCDDCGDWHD